MLITDSYQYASRRIGRRLHKLTWVLSLGLLGGMLGCHHAQITHHDQAEQTGKSSLMYSALVLNYETTHLRSLVSQFHPQSVSTSLVSHFQPADESEDRAELRSLSGQWSQARIQIIYPHPDGSENKGLARLIVSRKSPPGSQAPARQHNLKTAVHRLMLKASGTSPELAGLVGETENSAVPVDEEIWQLDLAKEELDILLSELSHRGFFEKQERPRGEAMVTIKVDEGALSKRWTSEPRLEGLMLQVYNEGELAAFNTRQSRHIPATLTRKQSPPMEG